MVTDQIRLYAQPGCSSCLKAREFLQQNVEEFEYINVLEDSNAMDFLLKRGIRAVPVVTVGDRHCIAISLKDLAEFLELETDQRRRLSPAELADRYCEVLPVAAKLVSEMPDWLMSTIPSALLKNTAVKTRHRPPGEVAVHIFEVTVRFLDACENDHFARTQPMDPARYHSASIVGDYATSVMNRLEEWRSAVKPEIGSFDREIGTWYGPQQGHDLLERCVWHSAQHTRQLHAILVAADIGPSVNLTEALLRGLPMPAGLWGD
jgi:glutaredoxin